MRQRVDKDLAWAITFGSFIAFLVSSVVFSILENQPSHYPAAILLANATLGRAFLRSLFGFARYLALAILGYGIVGIVTWPPGPGNV